MKVNPETLLFEGMSDTEADGLRSVAVDYLRRGIISSPYIFDVFAAALGCNETNKAVACQAFVGYALLSVLIHNDQKAGDGRA